MATAAETSAVADRTAPGGPAYEPVILAGKVEILPSMPLPALNGTGGPAFLARSLRDRKAELFAIVCTGGLLPRSDTTGSLRSIEHAGLVRLTEWGVVDWTPDGAKRFALVYERPIGRRAMLSLSDQREPMTEDQVTRQLIEPLAGALKELHSRAVVHADIRPTNLFMREQATGAMMLGECASAPPAHAQSPVFLTVERAMAMPSGRGTGTAADDFYALGVTALFMLYGRNPVKHLDDEAVLNAKIERGSYPALVGQHRISLSMMELLRGLLSDDPKQRWGLQDLDLWLSGRRLSPKQPHVPRKGARPFDFQGQDVWHCRGMARAFARLPSAAAQVIESGELDRWLRRSLSDDARADAVRNAVDTAAAAGRTGSFEDRLVARVCMALDPPAAIRYKGRAVMPDAFGWAIAEAFVQDQSPQPLAEMLAAQLPMFWVNMQPEFRAEYVPLVQSFDTARGHLERPGAGFGIERLLYELNPAMHCLSPMVRAHHPTTPGELMAALEQAAASPERSREPIDRHVAAFLAARYRKLDERLYAAAGGAGEAPRRAAAMLNILAEMQRRFGPPSLPALCAWTAELIDPALERFRNRPRREKLRAEAQRAARSGELARLLRLVDDPEQIRKDELGFAAARRGFERSRKEIERLRHEIEDRETVARTLGRQTAAIASSVLAMLLLVLMAVLMLKG
jgi:eukaryotic-like serine/threonine-protein kinase